MDIGDFQVAEDNSRCLVLCYPYVLQNNTEKQGEQIKPHKTTSFTVKHRKWPNFKTSVSKKRTIILHPSQRLFTLLTLHQHGITAWGWTELSHSNTKIANLAPKQDPTMCHT